MNVTVAAPDALRQFVELIWRDGDVREVRIPTPGRTDSGYFDTPDALVEAVARLDGLQNVYVTANPVKPALLARAANRIAIKTRSTTSDADIVCRRWLPIDIDPIRPSGISASEEERQAALEVARAIWLYLRGLGWSEPVTAMSGNGYWLLYPIELPNDDEARKLVEGVLRHLAGRFGSPEVAIDTTVANASRIVALIGTIKMKGDATAERPHRRSSIVRAPAELVPVPRDLLEAIAEPTPSSPIRVTSGITVGRMPAGWVREALDAKGIGYREGERRGVTWFRLDRCPFHPDDDQGGDCGVGEDADGKAQGHCFHNRGAGKGWQDFKAALGLETRSTPVVPLAPQRRLTRGEDAADLLAAQLPPLRWVVPELIPEGTAILAAPPKVGKSCLVYQIAVEASIGGDLFGRRVTPGAVLYFALEDGRRRGQDRLRTALDGRSMPHGRLEVRWDANDIGQGLEEEIAEWLDGHPDAVLVAIDTLGKVRGASDGRRNAYEVDVAAMARLQALFKDRTVALLIVHHARKESTDDFLASVSGTYGITGSADTIIAVRRKRSEAFGTIHVTGRDVADAEIPVRFDGTWHAAPGVLSSGSFERTAVYGVIEKRGPIFAKAIGDELGMERTAVQHVIEGLVAGGAVARVTGGYVVPKVGINFTEPPYLPLVSTHSKSEWGTGGDTRTRARADEDVVPIATVDPLGWWQSCHRYADHTSFHRRTPRGWTCDACYPVEQEGVS